MSEPTPEQMERARGGHRKASLLYERILEGARELGVMKSGQPLERCDGLVIIVFDKAGEGRCSYWTAGWVHSGALRRAVNRIIKQGEEGEG